MEGTFLLFPRMKSGCWIS